MGGKCFDKIFKRLNSFVDLITFRFKFRFPVGKPMFQLTDK